jgi:hypothetical protein
MSVPFIRQPRDSRREIVDGQTKWVQQVDAEIKVTGRAPQQAAKPNGRSTRLHTSLASLLTPHAPQIVNPTTASASLVVGPDGFRILKIDAGDVGYAQYYDGTDANSNGPEESIIGASIVVDSTALVGPSSEIPGAYEFEDTPLAVRDSSSTLLAAWLREVLVIPDGSVPGYDCVVQATLDWEQEAPAGPSRYLLDSNIWSERNALFFRSNLLAATGGLSHATSVPVPGTFRISTADTRVVAVEPGEAPQRLELAIQAPTPARTSARITWAVPTESAGDPLDLSIYDLAGRRVVRLASGPAQAKRSVVNWDLRGPDGTRAGDGIYFVRLTAGTRWEARKFVLMH